MIVLDASALVKLVLEEDNSDVARAVYKRELSSGERIFVPYLVLSESLNTVWKYHTPRKELDDKEFEQALNDLLSIFNKVEKVQEAGIAKLASEIAHTHRIAVYDAMYIAISRVMNAPLLSFDTPITKQHKKLDVTLAWNPPN